MAAVGDVTLSGTLAGLTLLGGQIGPVPLAVALTNQKYCVEVEDYPVVPGSALPGTPVVMTFPAIPSPLGQTLFIMKSDLPISFTINGAGPTHTLRAGGVFVMTPGVAVTSIQMANPGTSEARVYACQVVGTP